MMRETCSRTQYQIVWSFRNVDDWIALELEDLDFPATDLPDPSNLKQMKEFIVRLQPHYPKHPLRLVKIRTTIATI